MFQIFAARMFEQRVLTAYREKVARERQQKLLEELDEESRLDTQREAKKAKEAAKKKEKKRLQKQAKEEERLKKEAEKAAQEAAAKEEEDKRLEEQRQKKEEQRKKREAEKKAAEEERVRKEAERQRRAQEERERQAENERKQREAKEREKRKREEARKKEREEREAKEKEARDRKAQEERGRKAKEAPTRDKEAPARVDRESKDRPKQEQAAKRQPVALPPGLYPPSQATVHQSPHFQVATPILPTKVPTPARSRQPSQPSHQSHSSSPRSQQAGTEAHFMSASPGGAGAPQGGSMPSMPVRAPGQAPLLHHPQPSAPLSPLSAQGRGNQGPFGLNGLHGPGMNPQPGAAPAIGSGMMMSMPLYQGPPLGAQQRFSTHHPVPYPPGFPAPRQFPSQTAPFQPQLPIPAPLSAPQNPPPKDLSHSRKPSETTAEAVVPPMPIARPGPIGRPPSTTPDKPKKGRTPDSEVDKLATQLGSKALLEDSDVPLLADGDSKLGQSSLGAPGSGRVPFGTAFTEPKHDPLNSGAAQGWNSFGPSLSSSGPWNNAGPHHGRPTSNWPQPAAATNAFGGLGGGMPSSMARSHVPRPVAIRLMLVQACRQLGAAPPSSSLLSVDGFLPVGAVLRQVELLKSPNEPSVSMDELLTICDTEGNAHNGGGSFEVRVGSAGGTAGVRMVKFEPDAGGLPPVNRGDIGSALSGHGPSNQVFGPGVGAVGGPAVAPPGVGGGMNNAFGPPGRGF